MNETWLRRLAWGLALYAVIISVVSAVWLFSAADYTRLSWLEPQVRVIVNLGAPILGLIIVRQQPRQRVGWLFLILGVLVSFRGLGYAIYFGNGAQAVGYSPLELFLLWFTELTNLAALVGQALLLLWFPDGQLPSRRWRFLYVTVAIASALLFVGLFGADPNWNGDNPNRGIAIENPYGFIQMDAITVGFPGFMTLLLSTILAAVSMIWRYRSATQVVRYQIRWFVMGGFLFILLNFGPLFFIDDSMLLTNRSRLFYTIAFSGSIFLYLAVGLAILRYRLYDIDVIIRKTLQYAALSALLALAYFGSVVLLQTVVGRATDAQSPLVIVVSTLLIAALFAPLRKRVQTAVDRRFYRQKYDAQQVLAQFAQTCRDETDMDALTAELVRVVQETMQPEMVSVWLRSPDLAKGFAKSPGHNSH
jgi:hypothetical protein